MIHLAATKHFVRVKLIYKRITKLFNRYMIIVQITDISYPHVPFYADQKNVTFAAQ